MINHVGKIFFGFIFIATIASCEKKSCTNVVCHVGETCFNGECRCTNGFEGTDCATYSYLKYTSLNGFTSESCNPTAPFTTSSVYITWDGTVANRIQIHNLMGSNCNDVGAYIYTDSNNEGNTIQIPEQNCGASSVYGQGSYNRANHWLVLQLYYNTGGITYQCNTTIR